MDKLTLVGYTIHEDICNRSIRTKRVILNI